MLCILANVCKKFVKFSFLLSLSFSTYNTFAGAIQLDTSFNSTGYRMMQIGTQNGSIIESVALQNDGKIVLGGYLYGNSGPYDFLGVRVNTNGSLDTSYDLDGIVTTNLGPFDTARKTIIQPDEKILLGGDRYSGVSNTDFAINRYLADGSLDNSFDGNGIAAPTVSGFSDEHCYDMLLQPDGKIVMVGTTSPWVDINPPYPPTDLLIIRLNTDGSLDTTFNGTGKIIISFNGVNESANSVILQNDGKIVIGGFVFNGIKNDYLLMRFETNGFLDTTFGGSGLVITSLNGSANEISTLALQNDGKILAGGSNYIVRYNTDGTLDNAFGNSGIVLSPNSVNKLQVLNDGKIMNVSSGTKLNRFNSDGSLDTTFNGSGTYTISIPNFNCGLNSLISQTDEKLVVGGFCYQTTYDFSFVARIVESITRKNLFDYDGDGKSDISVFRPTDGGWYIQRSQAGFYAVAFGAVGDKVVPADFSGDGKTDVAVFRTSNSTWYVFDTSNNTFYGIPFGTTGDIPVPEDFDGDGKADINVFRPSTGMWFRNNSSNGQFVATPFGQNGDVPTVGDFDGDGKADIGVWRSTDGGWYRLNSSNNSFFAVAFGQVGDKVVPADYTGDGKTDIAVYRGGTWYILRSEDLSFYGIPFGLGTDVPSPGDYDGDGKADQAVYRNGQWFIQQSTSGFLSMPFGLSTDTPTPSAFAY